jgi:Mg2+ and Co2+ transporter CorA
MRSQILLLLFLSLTATIALGQAEGSAIRSMEHSANERLRGNKVEVSDQTNRTGGDVDLAALKKKNSAMNELIKSINADLANLQNGVRAADLPKKLKQLEKLAKELRQSIE